jgi:hypothetical protein
VTLPPELHSERIVSSDYSCALFFASIRFLSLARMAVLPILLLSMSSLLTSLPSTLSAEMTLMTKSLSEERPFWDRISATASQASVQQGLRLRVLLVVTYWMRHLYVSLRSLGHLEHLDHGQLGRIRLAKQEYRVAAEDRRETRSFVRLLCALPCVVLQPRTTTPGKLAEPTGSPASRGQIYCPVEHHL